MSTERGPVSPPLAVAFTVVGFFALVIAGFGMLSLLSGADVLPVAGLGEAPGIVAVAAAVIVFGVSVWIAVRRPHPSYWSVVGVVAATFLAYLAGLLLGAVISGTDAATALSAAGGFATSWFAVVLAAAALVAGWAAVALTRTRAGRPRWPWERRDD